MITDIQILAITTAYEQGVGRGHYAHHSANEVQNPYADAWRCAHAWSLGYAEGKKQAAIRAANPFPPFHAVGRCVRGPSRPSSSGYKEIVFELPDKQKAQMTAENLNALWSANCI